MLLSKTTGTQSAARAARSVVRAAPVAPVRRVAVRVAIDRQDFESAPTGPLLSKLEAESSKGQVYGKPLSKSESAALKAAITHWNNAGADISKPESLRSLLLNYLKDAATSKKLPLNIVEGSMVLLEQLYLLEARPKGTLTGAMTPQDMLCRWQLVIGADVGSIQYIPVVEELSVAPSGQTFNLDTDLNVIFTGFSGDSSWLSEGHLRYHVKKVRIELRLPESVQFWKKEKAPVKVDDGRGTCHPDPTKPHVNVPLPFPANELFIFTSNGDLGVLRSKLGGLILLLNKTPVAERTKLA